jgi:hypothetical protein
MTCSLRRQPRTLVRTPACGSRALHFGRELARESQVATFCRASPNRATVVQPIPHWSLSSSWQRRISEIGRRALNLVLGDDVGPGSTGGDEGCRLGAGLIDVDRWGLGRSLMEGRRSPEAAKAQNHNLE